MIVLGVMHSMCETYCPKMVYLNIKHDIEIEGVGVCGGRQHRRDVEANYVIIDVVDRWTQNL